MPMKPKFTKEEIVEVAYEIIRKNGISQLTARSLGKELGCSSCPIFTVFDSMDDVISSVKEKVYYEYNVRIYDAFNYTPAFKQVGINMITFAKEESNLFKFLFLQDTDRFQTIEQVIETLGSSKDKCIEVIMNDYQLNKDNAFSLFEHIWIYTYGLSCLCATRRCNFTLEELVDMLGKVFISLLMSMKKGTYNMETPTPIIIKGNV